MIVRAPNPEQKKAIEHTGGVTLAAGAGSGKTFVLVEHIVFLINKFFKEHQHCSDVELAVELNKYLSSIVLMTFTKKAAGELTLRLQNRVSQMELEGDSRWKLAKECLSGMTIGTIHGFCFKLLSQGFFSDFDPAMEMLSDIEFYSKIERLLNLFEDREFPDGLENEDDVEKMIFSNKKNLVKLFVSIFSNAELRLMWQGPSLKRASTINDEEYIHNLVNLLGVGDFIFNQFPTHQYEQEKKKKWYAFIIDAENLKESLNRESISYLEKWHEFFESIPRFPSAPKKSTDSEVIDYLDGLKKWRKFLKDNIENYKAFSEQGVETFNKWIKSLEKIFAFIEDNYHLKSGITFSDIEYLVCKGLEKRESREKISEKYKYLIVDEFQDTSRIQFKMMNLIINSDFDRFFCVGDLKQAIYGFRGGELGVFQECINSVSKNLSLKNNYRSRGSIIDFNNIVFDNIFEKGDQYSGIDNDAVHVEFQKCPEKDSVGEIKKYRTEIISNNEEKVRMTSSIYDRLESEIIFRIVDDHIKDGTDDVICILYRKLGPSRYLISQLINANISFTSQIKVPMSEDPTIGIFYLLLEGLMHFKDGKFEKGDHYIRDILNTYLKILNIKEIDKDKVFDFLQSFYDEYLMIGLFQAFRVFIFKCNISNSNFSNNMKMLERICFTCHDILDEIWKKLNEHFEDRYSIDFQYGDNPSQVIIQTAHGSKGLEYDHVVLGGIHTNGTDRGLTDPIGNLPGSFLWKTDITQKSQYKSPAYILENLYKKKKEFSESKRLFYVACTRAKKKISWADLVKDGKPLSYSKNSWINGIRSWENDIDSSGASIIKMIAENSEEIELALYEETKTLEQLPLFYKDSLGLNPKLSDDNQEVLAIIPEMSVTRLAMIVDCPRKFYLKNICKFEGGEFSEDENISHKEEIEAKEVCDNHFEGIHVKSNLSRGTLVHSIISKAIMLNGEIPEGVSSKKDIKIINWVLSQLKYYFDHNYQLISEEAMKFSVFGHMISGTPDLVLIPNDCEKNGALEVWDFKTGTYFEDKCLSYWFQLKSYAFGLLQMNDYSYCDSIRLVLCFVDQEGMIEKFTTRVELIEDIFKEWSKLGHLNQVNNLHCDRCLFGNLCHSL